MAAVESEHGYIEGSSMDGPELAPYPAYVQTVDQRRRWDVAYGIASGASALFEASGDPDPRFTWLSTRALYNSDFPTSGTSEPASLRELAADEPEQGELLDDDPDLKVTARERSRELIAAAQAAQEYGANALGADFAVEALETIFGDVDGLPGHDVDEAFAESLHPRQRAGKWMRKLGGLKKGVVQLGPAPHPSAATAQLNHDTLHRTMAGPPMHTAARKLSKEGRQNVDAARIAKHVGKPVADVKVTVQKHDSSTSPAKDWIAEHGLRGGIGLGNAQALVHTALTSRNPVDVAVEHVEAAGGRRNQALAHVGRATNAALPDPRDSAGGKGGFAIQDIQDDLDRSHEFFARAIEAGRWAHEHQDLLRLSGGILKHTGRAFGLVGADDEDV